MNFKNTLIKIIICTLIFPQYSSAEYKKLNHFNKWFFI